MKSFLKNIIFFFLPFIIIRRSKRTGVYITFDDGPHPENTLKIVKILKEKNAQATFFMVGDGMEKHPDVVNAVLKAGHAIGYHSYDHHSLKNINYNYIKRDFIKLKQLQNKFNFKFKLYRPPYGDLTVLSSLIIFIKRLKIVLWSVDSMDSFEEKEKVISNVNNPNVSAGDILLFHDDYDLTVEILPDVLDNLCNNGLICKRLN